MDNKKPVITGEKLVRDSKGRFVEGAKGNPNGRPKGVKGFTISDLIEAIIKVEEEKKIPLYEKFVKKAYVNPTVLIALIKKLIPDKTHTEIEGVGDTDIIIANARDGFKRKLDDIAKRYEEIGKDTNKQNNREIDKTADGGKK